MLMNFEACFKLWGSDKGDVDEEEGKWKWRKRAYFIDIDLVAWILE